MIPDNGNQKRRERERALKMHLKEDSVYVGKSISLLNILYLKYFILIQSFIEGNVVLDIEPTSLRLEPWYIYYYVHWTRLVITGLVPMTFLATVNILIFVLIRRQNIERSRKMSVNSHGSRAEARYFYNRKFLLNCINFQLLTTKLKL